ncbi:MAG TPA: amidohydrolase family protein [Actinocrinis sp.]|nr:amidohydrolase family protein [Actinocrinis sp.]
MSSRIDVHTHYLGGAVEQLFASGFSLAGGFKMSVRWTPQAALDYMDRLGIRTQILSAPWTITGTEQDPDLAGRFTRQLNEEYAELIAQYPGRFGAFAALPGDSPEAMLEELEYALDTLHLDGVLLTSNVDGHYLGSDWYEPVLAELGRRRVPVFLHPADSPVMVEQFGFGRPSSVCEFPFDTARNVINGIYRGAFQRYPGLKLILAHCGGALPTLGWRIAAHTVATGPDDADIDAQHVAGVLRGLYYETALAGSRNSLLPTLEVTGPDHILFGTDWPAAPEPMAVRNAEELMKSDVFTDAQLADVESGNAKLLFPRLA